MPNFYIKCLFEIWGKVLISSTRIGEGTIFSTVFVFSALAGERLMSFELGEIGVPCLFDLTFVIQC